MSWTDYVGYHDELHNYEVILQGINIRQTRAKKHCRVGGRRAVSRSVWFEEDTAVTNSHHLGPYGTQALGEARVVLG